MRIFDIIRKKKDGEILSAAEIEFAVGGFCGGVFGEGPMAALLMAICLNGLNREETSALTMAMANSGDILDISDLGRPAVDKHSTGGVGDKLTLTVAPMAAACGLAMAKMSGRSLGHTGGTIDKLAAIPGFKTELYSETFKDILRRVGVCIASQSQNLAPADKKIYALRDATATVDNISLIAASIMSKKIAAGAQSIVLDIKVGSGAFMKNLDEARQLARIMVDIGRDCGRNMSAVLTAMDAPLGRAVGNAVEVIEAVEVLRGGGSEDVKTLSIELVAQILVLAEGHGESEARAMAVNALTSGAAFDKFAEMVAAQGGDVAYIHDTSLFPKPKHILTLTAPQSGYVDALNGQICGFAAHTSGEGIIFEKKTGDIVARGCALAYIHSNDLNAAKEAHDLLLKAYKFSESKPKEIPLIYEIINAD
ncbi:MAG: thymidine phosphorylase [Clostridiales bacterium]|jgi:pyrimidine-nucleoside phosphorylase|nr:thymidine phosphorylase [Clostridiales bacterium]